MKNFVNTKDKRVIDAPFISEIVGIDHNKWNKYAITNNEKGFTAQEKAQVTLRISSIAAAKGGAQLVDLSDENNIGCYMLVGKLSSGDIAPLFTIDGDFSESGIIDYLKKQISIYENT